MGIFSPEAVALINALAPYVINIGGLIIAYLTLAGRQKKENDESRALIEKEKLIAKGVVDAAAVEALDKARKELDDRNKNLMDGVIEDNRDLKQDVGKLQEDADTKNTMILTLQGELKTTATECKDQIDRVVTEMATEMKALRDKLEVALKDQGRAEGMAAGVAAAAAPATPATLTSPTNPPSPLEAKGTVAISLDVVPKQE